MLILCPAYAVNADILDYGENDDEEVATVTIDKKIKTHNVTSAKLNSTVPVEILTKDGKDAICISNADGKTYSRLLIDIDDDFAYMLSDGTDFTVEIEYYDSTIAPITIMYDSEDKYNKELHPIYTEKTDKWQKAIFSINDAFFANRMTQQSDIAVGVIGTSLYSRTTIYIHSVKIIKHNQNELKIKGITTDYVGNIMGNIDKQNFEIEVHNYTNGPLSGNLKYRAIADDGEIVWNGGEETVVVGASKSKKFKITADVQKYGLFNFEAEITGEGTSSKYSIPFSKVNTIDDGTKNDKFGYNQYIAQAAGNADEAVEVLKRSNAGFVRAGSGWYQTEKEATGTYALSADFIRGIKALEGTNIGVLAILSRGNPYYPNSGTWHVPDSEGNLKAFLNYTKFFVSEVKKYDLNVKGWEIWNEPNLEKYNPNVRNGYDFGIFTREVAETIREMDKESIIFGGSYTGLYSDTTKTFHSDALEAGYGDIADLSLHAYSHSVLPEVGVKQEVAEYKKVFEDKAGRIPMIACTELGYVANPNSSLCKTTLSMAQFNVRLYIGYAASNLFDTMAWYALFDDGCTFLDQESSFGQVYAGAAGRYMVEDRRYVAKEGYVALTNMNKLLQNAENERTVIEDSVYAYIFRRPKDNMQIMPIWAIGKNEIFSFKCDAEHLTLYDFYGNAETIYGNDGVFSLSALNSVQYIEGNLNNLELVEDPVVFDYSVEIAAGSTQSISITGKNTGFLKLITETLAADVELADKEINIPGTVKVKMPDEIGVERSLAARVYDENDRLLFTFELPLKTTEPMTAEILTTLSEDGNIWGLNMLFTNHYGSIPVTGKMLIEGLEHMGESNDEVFFKTVPAMKTGEINLGEFVAPVLGRYPLTCTIQSDNGKEIIVKSILDLSVASYNESPPVIDGVISPDEWDYSKEMRCDTEDKVYNRAGYKWNGPDDLSTRTMIQYDEKNIYMAITVTDDVHFQCDKKGGNTWGYDGVQFGVAFEYMYHDAAIGGSFTQISIGDTEEGPCVYRDMSEKNENPTGLVNSAKVSVMRKGNNTVYEVAIPWTELTTRELDFDTMTEFSFSMLTNDNDGNGRKGWLEYGSGIGTVKDITQFTVLRMIK